MKKYEGKLRCCSNVVILMLFATWGVIREKSIYGYEYAKIGFFIELDWDMLSSSYVKELLFNFIFLFSYVFADCHGVLWWW